MASKPKLKSSALYFSLIAVLNVVVTLLVWHTKKVRLAAEHNPLAPIVESEPNSNGFVSVLQVGLWIASGLMGIHTLYSSCGHLLLKSRITQVARLQRAIEASEITEATCDTLQYPIRDALFTIQLWLVRRCGRQFDLDFHVITQHALVDMHMPTLNPGFSRRDMQVSTSSTGCVCVRWIVCSLQAAWFDLGNTCDSL
ncbi:hypothetical protein KCU63_g50, partial [Aureobasidium melanogenum]